MAISKKRGNSPVLRLLSVTSLLLLLLVVTTLVSSYNYKQSEQIPKSVNQVPTGKKKNVIDFKLNIMIMMILSQTVSLRNRQEEEGRTY